MERLKDAYLLFRSSDLWEDAHERSDELKETDCQGDVLSAGKRGRDTAGKEYTYSPSWKVQEKIETEGKGMWKMKWMEAGGESREQRAGGGRCVAPDSANGNLFT